MQQKYTFKKNIHINLLCLISLAMIIVSGFANTQINRAENLLSESPSQNINPILQSPKTQNSYYSNPMDYATFGIYIAGPSYIERFVGQTTNFYVQYDLFDSYEYFFDQYRIYVNNSLFKNDWCYNQIDFYIGGLLSEEKSYDILIQAHHTESNIWYNYSSILNVTYDKPCISPYYDNFKQSKYAYANIQWDITRKNGISYNYSFFIDGNLIQNGVYLYTNYLSINYNSFSTEGNHTLRLEILDQYGKIAINEFIITVVGNNFPEINNFGLENYCEINIWETSGISLKVQANDYDNDLEKIYIFANNQMTPFRVIENAENNLYYEIELSNYEIEDLMTQLDEYSNTILFSAYAVDSSGKYQNYWNDLYIQVNQVNEFDNQNEVLTPIYQGRNVESLTVQQRGFEDLEYRLTVALDSDTTNHLFIRLVDGEQYGYSNGHCRTDYSYCNIFEGKDYQDSDWINGGIVFWIGAENESSIRFPITIKILYPEWLEPQTDLGEPSLKVLHWVDDCNAYNSKYWEVFEDSDVRTVNVNAKEFYIESFGLYAFGMDSADYNQNDGKDNSSIPGFPIGFITTLISITTISIAINIKKRMVVNH